MVLVLRLGCIYFGLLFVVCVLLKIRYSMVRIVLICLVCFLGGGILKGVFVVVSVFFVWMICCCMVVVGMRNVWVIFLFDRFLMMCSVRVICVFFESIGW